MVYIRKHYTAQAQEIGAELAANFPPLAVRQLWLMVKLCKLARRSCRHNTAFNAAMTSAFPYAQFRQVPKTNPHTGKHYQGLNITINDETISDDADDDTDE